MSFSGFNSQVPSDNIPLVNPVQSTGTNAHMPSSRLEYGAVVMATSEHDAESVHASNGSSSSLGFGENNVLQSSVTPSPASSTSSAITDSSGRIKREIIVAATANLSTAYNLAIIDYVILLMANVYPQAQEGTISLVASMSLIGTTIGQLTFGYIGDVVGRRKGMISTLCLTVIGSLSSAFLPWGDDNIYAILAGCRFLLGVGVGGVYPLSATAAVESSSDRLTQDIRVATVFSFQGWGQALAPFLTFVTVSFAGMTPTTWRVLIGVGALPALFVLNDAIQSKESKLFREMKKNNRRERKSLFKILFEEGFYFNLIGTSLSWFLFDITFYGNVIFTPTILQHVFDINASNVVQLSKYSIFVTCIALPGYYVAICCVGKLSYRTIQLQGFLIMSALFLILGAFYDTFKEQPSLLFVLYAMTFFFANFGPNVSTFSLPAESFPMEVRVELNGISAACGKMGAVLGASIFHPLEEAYGVPCVLVICGIVSLVGYVVTFVFTGTRYGATRLDALRENHKNRSAWC